MRSVVVVLPASMWAMMPILRVRRQVRGHLSYQLSVVNSRLPAFGLPKDAAAAGRSLTIHLPPIMGESLVRFRHAMDVVSAS